MTTSDPSKKLQALIKRLRSEHAEPGDDSFASPFVPDEFGAVLHQFLYSMLLWDTTSSHAAHAVKRLEGAVVDLNELRICFAEELAELLGERYARSKERAQQLKAALTEIYKREHSLSLERVLQMNKRDAKVYLETIDGVPFYVAHRVLLVCVGGHAVPCDVRLQHLLEDEKAIEPGLTIEEASAWLEHQFKSGEGLGVHFLLQKWSDQNTPTPRKERKPEPPPPLPKRPPDPKPAKGEPAAKSAHKTPKGKPSKPDSKPEKSKSAK